MDEISNHSGMVTKKRSKTREKVVETAEDADALDRGAKSSPPARAGEETLPPLTPEQELVWSFVTDVLVKMPPGDAAALMTALKRVQEPFLTPEQRASIERVEAGKTTRLRELRIPGRKTPAEKGASGNLQEIVAFNIRMARVEAGLSQRELGRLSGISANRLSVIESSGGNVTLETIEELAKHLNRQPYELLIPKQPPRRP